MKSTRCANLELINLRSLENLISISKIEWWLLKYDHLYKQIKEYVYNQNLYEIEDGIILRTPDFNNVSEDEKFLDLYSALDELTELHRNENYFREELFYYYKNLNSSEIVGKWYDKNETKIAESYGCFLVDYLDYDVEEKVTDLSVFIPSMPKLELFVFKKDFEFTIKFIELYNNIIL